MTTPVRFGILGCGRVAPTHVAAIRALGDQGTLTAVCDSNPEVRAAFMAKTQAPGFSSLEEMLESDVDVVSICTPSGDHGDQGVQIAEAGKHVLVEKPMDVSLEAVDRMIEACKANGVKLFPIFQNRFNPAIQLVKEAIDKGRFGKILAVNSTVIWKRTQAYYDLAPWRGTKALDGGAFFNQGIHFVDAMRYLGGEVVEVKSMLGTLARDMECEDTGSALFRFENGALGNIFVTMVGISTMEGSITVIGEHGQVKVGGGAMNRIDVWEFQAADPEQDDKVEGSRVEIDSVYGSGHEAVYLRVVDDLNRVAEYPITPQHAKGSVEMVQKMSQGFE